MTFNKSPPEKIVLQRGSTWNSVASILDSLRRQPTTRRPGTEPRSYIFVRSDSDIEGQKVVGLGDSLVVPGQFNGDGGFRAEHSFEVVPTNRATTKFAVTFDALVTNGSQPGIGLAIGVGFCTVIANVSDVSHSYLAFTDTDGELESCNHATPIRLIYAAATGDGLLVKAFIGSGAAAETIIRCRLTSVLELCSTATAVILGPETISGSESASINDDCLCHEGDEIIVADLAAVADKAYSSLGWHAPIDSNLLVVRSPCDPDEYMVIQVGRDCCAVDSVSESGSDPCFQPFPFEMEDVPIGDPADIAYVPVWDANGCLFRVPKSSCTGS